MNPAPLRYTPPLSGDLIDAYKSMPTLGGFVVSLFYTPPGQLAAYESKWREWLKTHDKHLWPEWCEQWGQRKKRAG